MTELELDLIAQRSTQPNLNLIDMGINFEQKFDIISKVFGGPYVKYLGCARSGWDIISTSVLSKSMSCDRPWIVFIFDENSA